MDLGFDYDLVQSQKLLLTPQLKQAVDVLKMNVQELSEYIEQQLEENPLLEIRDSEVYMEEYDDITAVEYSQQNDLQAGQEDLYGEEDEGADEINSLADNPSTTILSLKEHLMFQLHTSNLSNFYMNIGEYIIDNIDENGYLNISVSYISSYFSTGKTKVCKILKYMQGFDPPGVCARNLKECLIIQLEQKKSKDNYVVEVIKKHLTDLASGRLSAISESTGLDQQTVIKIYDLIKTLEPKPGRAFFKNNGVKYIMPDLIVKKIQNKYEILINEEAFPIVTINSYYKRIITHDVSNETRKFIQNKIDSALNLIKCIEQRKNIIQRIGECILNTHADFFTEGNKNIKPMFIRMVADEINQHESLVCKIITGKYIQCSWGIFDMRYFFTGRVSNNT